MNTLNGILTGLFFVLHGSMLGILYMYMPIVSVASAAVIV